jgi:SPP1 gp7 family putative phage head morphogenesis protein
VSTQAALKLIDRYNRSTAGLEAAVIERIDTALDSAYRELERELRQVYPRIQGQGDLLPTQRKLLLLSELGELLQVVRPEQQAEYEAMLTEALKVANQSGATLGEQLIKAFEPDAQIKSFAGVPIEAVAMQARDGTQRLYRHSEDFRNRASAVVEQGLIQGWGAAKVAGVLRSELGTTKSKTETIARTEILSSLNDAAQQTYQDNDIELVQLIATADDRLCPTCSFRNGFVYPVGKIRVPLHPRCRCYVLPFKAAWQQLGLTNDTFTQKFRQQGLTELKAQGLEPNKGLSPFEKMAKLNAPPQPVWMPEEGWQDESYLKKLKQKRSTKPKATQPLAEPKPEQSVPDFPESLAGLEEVRALGGSTGAKLVRDTATGKQYVLKRGNSPDHLREEMAADAAYQALGIPVPKFRGYETKDGPVKLAEFIEGTSLKQALKGKPEEVAKLKATLQQHFAADALLGNWDVVGMEMDNILIAKDGTPYRIDNGGSLRYRAQGGLKGDRWNQYPTELWSLQNPDINEQTASVFDGLSYADLVGQMEALQGQKAALLKAIPKELHSTIEGRLKEMQHLSTVSRTLLNDQWTDEYVSRFAKHTLGIRAAGIVDRLPNQMTQTNPGAVFAEDENGKLFDSLRDDNSIIADLNRYMIEVGASYKILSDWMEDQADDSWNDQPKAFKYFLASQRTLPLDRYFWRYGLEQSQNAYKNFIQIHGVKPYQETFTAWHAFNHEMMLKTNFSRKNQDGSITLIRTEDPSVVKNLNGLSPGDRDKVIVRGPAESTSVYRRVEVFGSEITIQNVPAHRIFGTYWAERDPEGGESAFLGDSENEFIAMMDDIPFDYVDKDSEDMEDVIAHKQQQAGGAVLSSNTKPSKKSSKKSKSKAAPASWSTPEEQELYKLLFGDED